MSLLTQDIEEEGIHVVIERLVIQEELGHQAQALAIDFVLLAVNLKNRDGGVCDAIVWVRPPPGRRPVDLVTCQR